MKNNSGFTLIEVIISMLLLSIVFITYIHGFQDGVILLKEGNEFTDLTFIAQEKMENEINITKKELIDGLISADREITVFSGDYRSKVSVKDIVTNVTSERQFFSYVSDVPEPRPLPPKVDYEFMITNFNNTVDYFPWNDNIERYYRYEYELITNSSDAPDIFENRIRLYESKSGNDNPFFPGDYNVIEEDIITEPTTDTTKAKRMKLKDTPFEYDRFYFFEVSPYSLAGKITSVKNSYRIPKYKREGSDFWQELIEEVYFIKYLEKSQILYDSKFFEIITDVDTYGEVFQDVSYPRLDIDWEKNEDPEGAIVGKEIPNTYDHSNFTSEIEFKVDINTLDEGKEQGFGVMIGAEGESNTNNGTMFTFDVRDNKLMVHELLNGKFKGLIQEFNLITNTSFSNFIVNVGTGDEFDWDSKYTLVLEYRLDQISGDQTIQFYLRNEFGITSNPIIITPYDYGYVEHDFIGLKSYSGLDYRFQPESEDEISNEYFRYYGVHFYDIIFRDN